MELPRTGLLGLALAGCMALGGVVGTADAEQLMSNEDFEPDESAWETDDEGHRFVRLEADPDEHVMLYKWVSVADHAGEAMELTITARTDIESGDEGWHDARVIMHFKDGAQPGAGSNVSPSPGTMRFADSTDGEWVERTMRFRVPVNAQGFEMMPSLPYVQSGHFDLQTVSLRAISLEEVDQPEADPGLASVPEQAAEAEDLFAPPLLPMLKVVGNQIHDEAGEVVALQGLNVPSLEWNPRGENVLESIQVAVEDWNANVIRLPVREHFWFGQGEDWAAVDDGGAEYRALIDECIRTANDLGAYIILDLHRYVAPEARDVQFWEYAAARYKDHPGVLFGIMNEPHSTTWAVWRDGGVIERDGANVRVYGQQGLVDTVRETGATNIIVAGGLDWAYDLSGIAEGYALEDSADANGIMYDTHIYNWKRDWEDKVLVIADEYPILVGEWGAQPEDDKFDFVDADAQIDPYVWIPNMIGFIQEYELHQTAWCFHPSAAPQLIQDWDYEPTSHFGEFVKRMLHGEQFEMERKW